MSSSHLHRLQLCSNKRSLRSETWKRERAAVTVCSSPSQACSPPVVQSSSRPVAHTETSQKDSGSAMPLNNGNTVAVERRMDLASLFCMIGRHGPAVALALVAVGSLLAGFIIYRAVKGKRRKATAADGDGKSPGDERDTPAIQPSSVESTDVSDEGSSDVKEDIDPSRSDLIIRHRRAAEKAPPPYSPPKSDVRTPDNKHTTSDETGEAAVEWDSYNAAETCADKANWSQQSDTSAVAEMVLEHAADGHQGETDDTIKDVLEETHDKDSCCKEPEPNNEEKVLKAEDEDGTTDLDDSDQTTRPQDENFPCALTNRVFLDKKPPMSENGDDDGNNSLSPEEEKKNGSEEAGEECVDQQAEIWSSTSEQETSWQGQRDQETDKVTPPIRDCDGDEDDGLAGETIKEVVDEDHLKILAAVKFDARSPQFDEQDVEIEQKEENGLKCGREDGVLHDDQVKEKMLTGVNMVACSEEPDGSSVAPSPALPCLSAPIKAVNHDNGLSGITTDAKAQISGIAEFSDLSSDRPHPQKADKMAPALYGDTHSTTILGPKMPSHETENQPANNVNGTAVVLAEEPSDQVHVPHVKSCCEDEQSVQTIRRDTFDAAAPQIVGCDGENLTASVMAEVFNKASVAADSGTVNGTKISCPLPSTSQDQHSGHMEINETFEKLRVNSTTEAAACDNASCTALSTSVEISHPDISSLEELEFRDDTSSAGVGEESGISSMAVSPDAGNEFENTVLPAIGLYPSHHTQPPHSERTGWTNNESSAADKDMLGHEVEDRYHRGMDQFMAQVVDSVTSFTNDLEKHKDVNVVVEVKEKEAGESAKKEEENNAEKEMEEDNEVTEISIMEATMDHNEWIMDGNYQAIPWMNLSAPSFAQNDTKTNQLPSEEYQRSSAVTDSACIDATDIPPSTEVKQTSILSLGDENTENKKIVAVQPMPQHVDVTFRIHYVTQSPYQTVAVTGNQQELGNWKEFIPLERAKDGHWSTVVSLPAEIHVEWKFVVVDKGEVCRWEECGNRLLDTGNEDNLLVHKWWGRL
ncbi:uncharacterized protein stbd1 [Etheostoma spectabile]|uniref:uncharacterized protein stbd1 n=1 Tax=Etheostoma spectabile TaxID=54343 RepID=UPI0013AE97FD|nr:starch-binding domain-containing protein 1 [Etheostoma spectabile]